MPISSLNGLGFWFRICVVARAGCGEGATGGRGVDQWSRRGASYPQVLDEWIG